MCQARSIANRLLNELPDDMMPEIISYIAFIKSKSDNKIFKELEEASLTSTEFWDNQIDDEVWNNV